MLLLFASRFAYDSRKRNIEVRFTPVSRSFRPAILLSSNICRKMVSEGDSIELTEQEAELYDRQIRLWGLDSQKR